MTAPTMAPPAKGGAPAPGGGKNAQPTIRRPFVAGTRRVDKSTYDNSKTLTAATQDMPVYECDPNGFLRGLYLVVQITAAGNSAAVAFNADAPFNAIDLVTLNDTNNKPIIGPMNGHDLYECVKFGGYAFIDDMKQSNIYSVTTGTGATGGSVTFVLPIPVEICRRDALGSLPNKSSSATFNVTVRIAALATIYSTAPTAAPTFRLRIQQWGWMDPNAADMRGNPVSQNPPAVNTTQYWTRQSYTINAGAFNIRLQGLDAMVRGILFILVDSTGSRAQGESDWPDPFGMLYETSQPVNRLKLVWQHMLTEWWGYTGAVETAGGRDNGVYPETYAYDFSDSPGNETRLGYLPFSSATNASINGTIGGSGSHTLYVLANKIVPANGDPMSLTGR